MGKTQKPESMGGGGSRFILKGSGTAGQARGSVWICDLGERISCPSPCYIRDGGGAQCA